MALDPETRELFSRIADELEASREYHRENTLILRKVGERMDENGAELDAARAEIRAQTRAIFRVFDRINGPHPGDAPA